MFDGPMPAEPALPDRRAANPVRVLAIFLFTLSLLIAFWRPPHGYVPSPLRQIEISPAPGTTDVYVRNAGYRLLHKRWLIATVQGDGPLSAYWLGPDKICLNITNGAKAAVRAPVWLKVVPTPCN